ncbi:MAG TPA: hypothetical protein EYQ14_27930, partial [Gammaproteobacteria bacterium]|nr:hypothetical protein [Gammaproteobacteria bacterium]
MNLHSQTHYLVRAIYHPRVAAFFLAVLVTLSQFFSDHDPDWPILGLIVILVCYPHIAYWITAERYNTASGARCSLMFDSLLVGCLIIANGFYMFAGLSFIVALSLSTLFVAQPRMLAINLGIVTTVCLTGWVLAAQAWQSASLLTNALCALSLFCHSCIVGLIGFRVTASLGKSRQTIEKSRDRLVGVTRYLKRYVSPQVFSSIEINQKEIKTRRKRLTVFFSDIEGFTTLMDNLEEETVTTMLNEYLNAMAEIAIDYGGTVDKFIGDGIMVF